MERDKATLRDVAKHAGVSVGSVSRYLNNHPSLSARARQAIESAIAKLNYTPNQMARKFAKGVSSNLLLFIYQEFPIFNTTWLFELPIIHGIYDYLQETHYSLQIAIGSISRPEQFRADLLRQVDASMVDGVMILSSWSAEKTTLLKLMDSGFHYALLGNENQLDGTNSIVFDNSRAVEQLVATLWKMGHRNFAYLGGYESQSHTRERLNGFIKALADNGKKARPEWIKFGDYSFESGIAMMDELFAAGKPPTAVLAGNDFVAAGVMRSIKQHGLSVPGDISVTGFDNLTVADIVEPELTTVKVPLFEIGRLATQKLVEGIAAKQPVFPGQVIQCEIVERNSTAKAAKR